jgi:hypothetical protein
MKHLPPSQSPEYWREPDISVSCKRKWRSGLQEHRGGLESRPFRGHPEIEKYSECLDGLNYNSESLKQGIIDAAHHQEIELLFLQIALYMIL